MSGMEFDQIWVKNSPESGAEKRLTAALRRRWPNKTAESLSALDVAPVATARKWLAGDAYPSGLALLRLIRAGGLSLLVDLYGDAPAALVLAARSERRTALRAELASLDAALLAPSRARER